MAPTVVEILAAMVTRESEARTALARAGCRCATITRIVRAGLLSYADARDAVQQASPFYALDDQDWHRAQAALAA